MKHEQFQELVSLFIDRELDVKGEQELFVHLSSCEECRGFLKTSLTLQGDILESKPSGAPPLESIRAFEPSQARVNVSSPKGRMLQGIWQKRVPFPIAATFAVLALVSTIAVTSFWMRSQEKPAETTQEVVYVQRLPAIQVIGFYPPSEQSKK